MSSIKEIKKNMSKKTNDTLIWNGSEWINSDKVDKDQEIEKLTKLLGQAASIINNRDAWIEEAKELQEWYVNNLDVLYAKVQKELADLIRSKRFDLLKMYLSKLDFNEKEIAHLLIKQLQEQIKK